MIRMVICDMDGTLIDSERAIALAAKEALVDWGIDCRLSDFLTFTGQGDDRFIGGVAEKYGVGFVPEMKEAAYDIYTRTANERVKIFPWTHSVLSFISFMNVGSAIASASDRRKVDANISIIARMSGAASFDAVVTGSDVVKQKPDPEIFMKALEKVNTARGTDIPPSDVLVLEDSTMGVAAAKAAGMICISPTTSYPREELYKAGVDIVLDDLSEIRGIICRVNKYR